MAALPVPRPFSAALERLACARRSPPEPGTSQHGLTRPMPQAKRPAREPACWCLRRTWRTFRMDIAGISGQENVTKYAKWRAGARVTADAGTGRGARSRPAARPGRTLPAAGPANSCPGRPPRDAGPAPAGTRIQLKPSGNAASATRNIPRSWKPAADPGQAP